MSVETTVTEAVVLSELSDGVLTVTINRPEVMNALNAAVSEGVARAMVRADEDRAVRVVVLTGAGGRAFSAGADLKDVAAGRPAFDADGPYGDWGLGGHTRRTSTKPVIAAVEGIAYGGGFELALNADLVVASRSSRFALPEVRVGLFAAAGGVIRIARALPAPVAARLALTGEPIGASEAAAFGLVSVLAEPGEALSRATELAEQVAAVAPLATAATKAMLRSLEGGHDSRDAACWTRNDALFADIVASEDAREGALAFTERRAPHWSGS